MIEPHLHYQILSRTPTLHNPPRDIPSNLTATPSPMSSHSANYYALLTSRYRYMKSGEAPPESDDELAIPIDGVYASTDEFRMYEFKIRQCIRAKAHDWTECPFAHPGEKAHRRDPRRYPYSGMACTDIRKGVCMRGDNCELAHGVFESWLHPTRYRTQACKDGPNCTRRVCFFAHSAEQLRVLSGLPSPRSIRSGPNPFEDLDSPVTPISQLVSSRRNLLLSRMQSMGSPRFGSVVGPVKPTWPGEPIYWEEEEEPVMERVESGRELRAMMFEKMIQDNPLTIPDLVELDPDVGWVTELVK